MINITYARSERATHTACGLLAYTDWFKLLRLIAGHLLHGAGPPAMIAELTKVIANGDALTIVNNQIFGSLQNLRECCLSQS